MNCPHCISWSLLLHDHPNTTPLLCYCPICNSSHRTKVSARLGLSFQCCLQLPLLLPMPAEFHRQLQHLSYPPWRGPHLCHPILRRNHPVYHRTYQYQPLSRVHNHYLSERDQSTNHLICVGRNRAGERVQARTHAGRAASHLLLQQLHRTCHRVYHVQRAGERQQRSASGRIAHREGHNSEHHCHREDRHRNIHLLLYHDGSYLFHQRLSPSLHYHPHLPSPTHQKQAAPDRPSPQPRTLRISNPTP